MAVLVLVFVCDLVLLGDTVLVGVCVGVITLVRV